MLLRRVAAACGVVGVLCAGIVSTSGASGAWVFSTEQPVSASGYDWAPDVCTAEFVDGRLLLEGELSVTVTGATVASDATVNGVRVITVDVSDSTAATWEANGCGEFSGSFGTPVSATPTPSGNADPCVVEPAVQGSPIPSASADPTVATEPADAQAPCPGEPAAPSTVEPTPGPTASATATPSLPLSEDVKGTQPSAATDVTATPSASSPSGAPAANVTEAPASTSPSALAP